LKNILKNKDIKLFNKLNNKDTVIYPCHKKDEWVVSLPIHPLFWKEKNMNKELLNQLGVV
jgi:hypothetical protein